MAPLLSGSGAAPGVLQRRAPPPPFPLPPPNGGRRLLLAPSASLARARRRWRRSRPDLPGTVPDRFARPGRPLLPAHEQPSTISCRDPNPAARQQVVSAVLQQPARLERAAPP